MYLYIYTIQGVSKIRCKMKRCKRRCMGVRDKERCTQRGTGIRMKSTKNVFRTSTIEALTQVNPCYKSIWFS